MNIGRVYLLAVMVWGSSATVSADPGAQRLQAFAGDRGGHSQVVSRGSIRYQDPFFSLSYRYNDFGWDRYPRSRHQGWRFGQHRHSPKYARGRHSERHFYGHNRDHRRDYRKDRHSDLIRHQRFDSPHFEDKRSNNRHLNNRH